MSARYLIRLDDACDTADHGRWALMEEMLDRHRIKPIVAVVTDNRDPKLMLAPCDPGFWQRVRDWQAKGWTIGMHGHTHLMHPTRSPLLLPFYERSEFAGLAFEEQAAKIRAAWQKFAAEDVAPRVWVAPAHSFDEVTLRAVHAETPIRIVSDGIAWNTFHEHGFHWIPQQMWGFAERRSGLWTVGLHPNEMSEAAIRELGVRIERQFAERMTCVERVPLRRQRKSLLGRLYGAHFWRRWRNRPLEG